MDIIDLSLVQIVRFNMSPAALKIQLLIIGKVISIHRDWCIMEFDLGIVVHGMAQTTLAAMIPIARSVVWMISLGFVLCPFSSLFSMGTILSNKCTLPLLFFFLRYVSSIKDVS